MKRLAVAAVVLVAVTGITSEAFAQTSQEEIENEGVGLYTDPSVAQQVSTFTINPRKVSCGVGTVDAAGAAGPFEMIMFSVGEHAYRVNRRTRSITADGSMRSITRVAGVVVDDFVGPFIGFAVDNQPSRPQPNATDRFEVHFITPFWQVGNPLCTPSERIPGGCRFGGRLFLGDVSVTPF